MFMLKREKRHERKRGIFHPQWLNDGDNDYPWEENSLSMMKRWLFCSCSIWKKSLPSDRKCTSVPRYTLN